jgi:hypothetical protein
MVKCRAGAERKDRGSNSLPRGHLPLLLVLALCFTAVVPATAHPGIGIVMDQRGNVFYTDLSNVWRISPDGTKSIAVPFVHTHELFLDPDDNIFGEQLWH